MGMTLYCVQFGLCARFRIYAVVIVPPQVITNRTRTLRSTVRRRREEDPWQETGRKPQPLLCALINSSLANSDGEKADVVNSRVGAGGITVAYTVHVHRANL